MQHNDFDLQINEKFANDLTRVNDHETIYDALRRKKLLREPNGHFAGHLVPEGNLGMCMDNGKPFFLAPGRHILYSPLNNFIGIVPITKNRIKLGNIEIITIDKSELGLSTIKGEHILLESGQHILQTPQFFVETKKIDKDYVRLGTHHRISVPIGNVAIAYNEGKKLIITPVPLNVDKEHEPYIICTKGKMFQIQSATFNFDEEKGFKSIQMEDIQLEKLTVNTREMISLQVIGSVRYRIVDPVKAFLITEDVVADIKKQAYATLTSVFTQLSIDEIAPSIASTTTSKIKDDQNEIPDDMLHHATSLFMEEFKRVVELWGVEAQVVNITNLQLVNESFKSVVQERAKKNMEANTGLSVVEIQTQVQIQEAEREKRKKTIEAEGESEFIKRIAEAKLYAAEKQTESAKLLSSEPLAVQLSLMEGQEKIAKNLGDKTVITDFKLGNYITKDMQNQMLFFNNNKTKEKIETRDLDQRLTMLN